jgi:protein-tyrosine phosphatase
MKKILFVCLGNICRSPTAEGVFRHFLAHAGMEDKAFVDSAGTAAWHEGKAPDPRSIEFAKKRGYDLSSLRARQVTAKDFEKFDYILAMDKENLLNLQKLKPDNYTGELELFLNYAHEASETEVPDPYYGGDEGFGHVIDLIESASKGLLKEISLSVSYEPT